MTLAEDTYVAGLADEIAAKVLAGLQAHDDRPLLTIQQAAERLSWGRRTLEERMERGEIAWIQVGREGTQGARRIEPAEIDRFIAARRVDLSDGSRA